MAARLPVDRPSWTHRVPGWSFLLFFASLIVLTYFAVDFWNRGDLVTTGYLAGLASVVPLVIVVFVYYALPVWAIAVPLSAEAVATALSRATREREAEPVAEREGLFSRCVSVVRFDSPACTLGWYPVPVPPKAVGVRPQSLVMLRPETRDRKALAAFRDALARSFLATESSPA